MNAQPLSGPVLIVDDEPLARSAIRVVVSGLPDVHEILECGCGEDAVSMIGIHDPSLVFLDVRMPDIDGFEVLRRLGAEDLPPVVFVTAYGEHAVRAFDAEAVDYVVKPFTDDRLIAATRRALERGRLRSLAPLLEAVTTMVDGGPAHAPSSEGPSVDSRARRFIVRSRRRIYFVAMESVDYIRAEGNYAALVTGSREHLVRASLRGLEAQLDPAEFLRIHRSTIVNLDRIHELRPEASGDCAVVLKDGRVLRLSRRYRERLGNLLI